MPGWLHNIELNRLNMYEGKVTPGSCGCVGALLDAATMGSEVGSYRRFMRAMFKTSYMTEQGGFADEHYGFTLPAEGVGPGESDKAWAYLTMCWKLEIIGRRKRAEGVGVGQGKGEDDKRPSTGPST